MRMRICQMHTYARPRVPFYSHVPLQVVVKCARPAACFCCCMCMCMRRRTAPAPAAAIVICMRMHVSRGGGGERGLAERRDDRADCFRVNLQQPPAASE